jgi:hypothetical protein
MKQTFVDFITPRQRFIEIEGTNRCTNVCHRQVADRRLEVLHLVGGPTGVDDLPDRRR